MILLWGSSADIPIAEVARALRALGAKYFIVDARYALETEVEVRVEQGRVTGSVRVRGEGIELADVSAIYARPPDATRAPAVLKAGEGSAAYHHALAVHEALCAFSELTPALVVNKVSAQGSNGSKPYQLELIERAGFAIPETLVTTEPQFVQEFLARHGDVIYKSTSGVRSIVARLTREKLQRLGTIETCPTQFQRYVPGIDFRVHVIGERVFCARVESSVVDYRYASRDGKEVTISAAPLPDVEAERCRALTRSLALEMAGLDLRQAPDGKWYCFEVNPSPAFTFYERDGQNMSSCVAELLVGAASRRSPS